MPRVSKIRSSASLTYGEAHTAIKDSMRMVNGEWVTDKLQDHKERMNKDEASIYYTNKLRSEFIRLGYSYKKNKPNYQIEKFDSVEDYYGYYEALKFKESLYDQRTA